MNILIMLAALVISQPADKGAYIPKAVAMPVARPVDAKTSRVRCYILTEEKRFTVGPDSQVTTISFVRVLKRCN